MRSEASMQRSRFGLFPDNVRYRSQLVSYPYFLVAALLFLLQILFGLLIVSQYVWPNFWLNTFPFNFGRETHLNLLIFWLLLGLMGASYYLLPEEVESEIYSERLAQVQLGVLLLAGLGTMASFWFLKASEGKPFTESPVPWPWLIVVGLALFLFNMGMTIVRAPRRTPIAVVLFFGMAGLAALYLIDLFPYDNLAVDYFWWWWIIHLWVEGTWELIAAAVAAFLLIKMTGVEREHTERWLYVQVSLVLFTGIIGIGHHYYWIGTPHYWLILGAAFSALEPLPIVAMTYEAFRSMRRRQAQPNSKVAWYWFMGSVVGHMVGAGILGFAQTLPQVNRWSHGTLVTASHGHFAFFGAFAMLVLSSVYFMVPKMRGAEPMRTRRGMWSFWLMSTGIAAMVLCFAVAGIIQIYLWRMAGLDFMVVRENYLVFWLFMVFFFGLTMVLPGVLLYLRDFFFGMRPTMPGAVIDAGPTTVPRGATV